MCGVRAEALLGEEVPGQLLIGLGQNASKSEAAALEL